MKGSADLIWGCKVIRPTDKNKSAIVADEELRNVLEAAGLRPEIREAASSGKPDYTILPALFGDEHEKVGFTYYASVRGIGRHRSPEPRIGRIVGRLAEGDRLAIIWNGVNIHFRILGNEEEPSSDEHASFDAELQPSQSYRRQSSAWQRDNRISREARSRAQHRCEAPDCDWESFTTAEGTPFIEVHHIQPLAEGGPDSLDNCIALCPGCHSRAHYANEVERNRWRNVLQEVRRGVSKA